MQATTNPGTSDPPVSDQDLITLTRDGSDVAYRELWRRHSGAGVTAATDLAWVAKPDELVAEAFATILITLRSNSGPSSAFRPYLYTVIRSIASRAVAQRTRVFDESSRPNEYHSGHATGVDDA